jgi:signal transduction histidine kinase
MGMLFRLFLASFYLILPFFIVGQHSKEWKELSELKQTIRQSTYYDSTTVFKKGNKAIQIARKIHAPSEEAVILQYFGNFYYFSAQPELAKKYYLESIAKAREAGNVQLVNLDQIRLAFVLSDEDAFVAEKKFKAHLKTALANGYKENAIEIYNGLGNIYDIRQLKEESLEYYFNGLKLAEEIGDKYRQAMILNNIGLIKFTGGQVEEAEMDFIKGLQIIKGMDEGRLRLNLNNNLGLISKESGKFKASIKYYHNTLNEAKKLGFPMGIGVAYVNLADSYLSSGNFTMANAMADTSILLLEKNHQWNFLSMAYGLKSSVLRQSGDLTGARAILQKAKTLNESYPYPENILYYLKELSDIEEVSGNMKEALRLTKAYHVYQDSITDLANKDKLLQMQILYGKDKIENELQSEKNKNTLLVKENELEKTKIQSVIFISILFTLLTLLIVFSWVTLQRRRQQKQFTQDLISHVDDERSRISKDLHDDLGQSLSMIKSRLSLHISGKTNDLSGLNEAISDVIDKTRNISHELHPSMISKLGLERSLVSLIEQTQEHTGMFCSIETETNLHNFDLEIQSQLYRILQECINNTIKHAEASALKISISHGHEGIELIYQDNGKGMGEQIKTIQGIGLLTIKERVDKIGGKVNFQSGNEKGFKMNVFLPKSMNP